MSLQLHRPQIGEHFVNAHGDQVRIDAVHYETRREVFRVSWPDPDSPVGRRGCQVCRDGDAGWRQWLGPSQEELQWRTAK